MQTYAGHVYMSMFAQYAEKEKVGSQGRCAVPIACFGPVLAGKR